MNFAEKAAVLYLRLNGFFLMPQFTTFGAGSTNGTSHDHTDILAFRPGGAFERHGPINFPIDALLFDLLAQYSAFEKNDPRFVSFGVVCEVRANRNGKFAPRGRLDYCATLFGGHPIVPLLCDAYEPAEIGLNEAGIRVGLTHALQWIFARVQWLDDQCAEKKTGSWAWSDEFLGDLLLLREFYPIIKGREVTLRSPLEHIDDVCELRPFGE
jgi:hypothetical protein